MKVVAVTVFHSFISKNILSTQGLSQLLSDDDLKVVLIVPGEKKFFFQEQYGELGVEVWGFQNQRFNTIATLFDVTAKLLIDTQYLSYKRVEEKERIGGFYGRMKYMLQELTANLLAEKQWFRKIFIGLDKLFVRERYFDIFFENYKVDLVFSTDLYDLRDIHLLREATFRNIKTIGMVRSWDNCLSKGLLRAWPNKYLVNNAVLKEQLVERHGVARNLITTVGLPQFDSFVTEKPEPRASFLDKLGFDSAKKLVVFAPGGSILTDTDKDMLEILLKAKDENLFAQDVQFFVRNHPHHPADFSGLNLNSRKDVYIQNPGTSLGKNEKLTELTADDQTFLRNLMAHTDVLLWVATSLCLDALVYDVPQVVLNFDGYDVNRDYYHSVKRYHDEEHMTVMFKHKPFKVANSPSELIEYMNVYLHDRTVDEKERDLVRQQQLYLLDGKSGERVAEEIKKCL